MPRARVVDVLEKPQRPHREAEGACLLQIRPAVIPHWGGKNRVAFSVSPVINKTVFLKTYCESLSPSFYRDKYWAN